MKILFYLILAAGIGNTVLRPEIEDPLTLYRILAPIGLLAVFAMRPMFVLKALGLYLVFFLYNFVLASAYGLGYSQFFPSIVHYLYLYVLLILMIEMKRRYPDFDESLIRFGQFFFVFLMINLVFELVIGSYYPNLYVDETDERQLRAFFWNQNDLAVVMCVIAWVVLSLDRFRGVQRIAVVALTIAVLYYNDSKAALLSFLFLSIPIFMIFRLCARVRISRGVWIGFFSTLFVGAVVLLVALSDIDISFANDTYTLADLLVNPVTNIFSLQSSGEEWGSLNNRTDAAIFVIIEYLRSFGFGLGAGGSWLVLSLPQYELGGAKSPHNALLQFIVDFGYPVVLGYAYLVMWAIRRLFTHRADQNTRLKVMAILSFPLLGLSQSGAIVTNYFFFAAVFFIVLLDRKPAASPIPVRPANRRPRLARRHVDARHEGLGPAT